MCDVRFPCTRDWTDCCGVLIDTDLSVKVDPHSVVIDTESQADKEIPVRQLTLTQ